MAKGQGFAPDGAQDAFLITPSDSALIVADAGNTKLYAHCYVHNGTATGGQVRVLPVDSDTAVTIYIGAGATSDLAVKKVFATSPAPPATLIGFIVKNHG